MIDCKVMSPEEEYKIVQASIKDPKQFRLLYDAHYYTVFCFVNSRVSDVNRTADIVSEVFFKALTKLKSYKFKGYSLKPWLLRIAYNEIMNVFRKNDRTRTVSIETSALPNLSEEIDDEEPIGVEALIPLLNTLSEQELNLIEMKFFEQRTYIEIAEIINVSVSNARVKTHRVIQKLRKQTAVER